MGVWADRVVPHIVDKSGSNPHVDALRDPVCAGLHGRVLEIGFGSGLNVDHYPAQVASVHAVEPRPRLAAVRGPAYVDHGADPALGTGRAASRRAGRLLRLRAVDTHPVHHPGRGPRAEEVRRVLRPGGRLHFLEHGLAPDTKVATWQRRLNPLQGRLFAGCRLDRDIAALVGDAGLHVEALETSYLPGPAFTRPWVFGYQGRAARPA